MTEEEMAADALRSLQLSGTHPSFKERMLLLLFISSYRADMKWATDTSRIGMVHESALATYDPGLLRDLRIRGLIEQVFPGIWRITEEGLKL